MLDRKLLLLARSSCGPSRPATSQAPPSEEDGTPPEESTRYVLIPRSPEGIVYYLGQLARAQGSTDSPGARAMAVPWFWDKDQGERLAVFSLASGKPGDGKMVPTVEYAGASYHVPGDWAYPENGIDEDRSLMTMTFIQLLFGLQRKGKEFPSTPVVVAQ